MKRSIHIAAVSLIMLSATQYGAAQSQTPPQKVAWASRAGMAVTVISSSGLGTTNAVIAGRFTGRDARAVCVEYELNTSKTCIQRYLRETKLQPEVRADCLSGRFTTFGGQSYQFAGRYRSRDAAAPEFNFIDLQNRVSLDGSSASGYEVALDVFKALCPGKAR